jgi:hypothetical protein
MHDSCETYDTATEMAIFLVVNRYPSGSSAEYVCPKKQLEIFSRC